MSYEERKQWILNYLKNDRFGMVGASDLEFLEAFANAHIDELEGLKHTDDAVMRTLRRMYKEGILYRVQHNMQGWETPSGYGAHTYLYGLKENEPEYKAPMVARDQAFHMSLKGEQTTTPEYRVLARYKGGFPFMTKKE
jgi:hypothetical protein